MSYPSSRSIVSGGNGGISRTGERLHSREFLYRVPKSRASREEKERGLCSGERWLVLQKKKKKKRKERKKKKSRFGSPNVVEKSHGHWGCRKSVEQRTFRGAADKGGAEKALSSWEVPRSLRRHWGEGDERRSLGQWPGVPLGPCLGFKGVPWASPYCPPHTARIPPPRRIQLDHVCVHPPLARTRG